MSKYPFCYIPHVSSCQLGANLTVSTAAAVASVFGWMNLFCRGLGGFLSDVSNAYMGMRGRLIWQHISFFFEGVFIMIFSNAESLGGAIASLMAFR